MRIWCIKIVNVLVLHARKDYQNEGREWQDRAENQSKEVQDHENGQQE
jgi:hypothetical protein